MSAEAVHLRFPARAEYLLLARLAVSGVARRMGLGGKEVADLKLAVTEACSNAVRHAYPASLSGVIELELVTGDGSGSAPCGSTTRHGVNSRAPIGPAMCGSSITCWAEPFCAPARGLPGARPS